MEEMGDGLDCALPPLPTHETESMTHPIVCASNQTQWQWQFLRPRLIWPRRLGLEFDH